MRRMRRQFPGRGGFALHRRRRPQPKKKRSTSDADACRPINGIVGDEYWLPLCVRTALCGGWRDEEEVAAAGTASTTTEEGEEEEEGEEGDGAVSSVPTTFSLPPPPEPKCFGSDYEYFQTLEAKWLLHVQLIDSLQSEVENRIFRGEDLGCPSNETLCGTVLREELCLVAERLDLVIASRLSRHKSPAAKGDEDDGGGGVEEGDGKEDGDGDGDESDKAEPLRIIRAGLKFGFSACDMAIFELLLVMQVSQEFATRFNPFNGFGRGASLSGLAIAKTLGADVSDVSNFFRTQRIHIKEGLVQATTSMHSQNTSTLLPEDAVTVLLGFPLTETTFMRVESPKITELVTEEPGFSTSKLGQAVRSQSGDVVSSSSSTADGAVGPPPVLTRSKSYLDTLRRDATEDGMKEQTLYEILRKEENREREEAAAVANAAVVLPPMPPSAEEGDEEAKEGGGHGGEEEEEEDDLQPYENDLQYLQDQFHLVSVKMKLASVRRSIEDSPEDDLEDPQAADPYGGGYGDNYDPMTGRLLGKQQVQKKRENVVRKYAAKQRLLQKKIERRLALLLVASNKSPWQPRLERLALALGISDFEKNIIIAMIGSCIAPSVVNFNAARGPMGCGGGGGKGRCTINDLLNCFCDSLESQIASRKFFYKSAILVKEGILNVHGLDFSSDLTECDAEIDRRMLDFVVGLDTEFSEIIDGSHLYTPDIDIDNVIVSEEQKKLCLETVRNFDTYKLVQKNLGVDKMVTYGLGMALLFFGPSGTGKTMMANALATSLRKKILLINFPYLGTNEAGAIVKLIFREAKIHDAVLFFDECESIFMTRERSAGQVNMLLTELERHDGLSILATNRPYDLDEAMHRRITLAIEFRKPDHLLRARIWQNLCPPKLELTDDVNLNELAIKFELSGGFIKNAWMSALSIAVSRDGVRPVVSQDDLLRGATHQLRGRLSMVDFDRRVVPSRGLDDVILPEDLKSRLGQIVNYGKAQAILFGQWGFHRQHGTAKGVGVLMCGPPGTGKTMAAEAIGFDLGKPLKVVNCAQVLSKWVGESQKNIDGVFEEAQQLDAVLVFDEAEGLFGDRSSDGSGGAGRHDTMNVGILLHHIENFSGVVVVITNLRDRLDAAFFRRFKFILNFEIPNEELRAKLWRLLIPEEAPVAEDVDFAALARGFELAGGSIKSAVFRAATEASLRQDKAERLISMADLRKCAQDELDKQTADDGFSNMMYA